MVKRKLHMLNSAGKSEAVIKQWQKLGEPMPNIPEMGKFWSSMASALENISNGRQSPKEALDAAAARMTGK